MGDLVNLATAARLTGRSERTLRGWLRKDPPLLTAISGDRRGGTVEHPGRIQYLDVDDLLAVHRARLGDGFDARRDWHPEHLPTADVGTLRAQVARQNTLIGDLGMRLSALEAEVALLRLGDLRRPARPVQPVVAVPVAVGSVAGSPASRPALPSLSVASPVPDDPETAWTDEPLAPPSDVELDKHEVQQRVDRMPEPSEHPGRRNHPLYSSAYRVNAVLARDGLIQWQVWGRMCGLDSTALEHILRRHRAKQIPAQWRCSFIRMDGPGGIPLRYVDADLRGRWLRYWIHLERATRSPDDADVERALAEIIALAK